MISTRPLSIDEASFAYQVYAGTRLDELSCLPWTDDQKHAFLCMQFELRRRQYSAEHPEALTEMILCDARPAGTLITAKSPESVHLVDIALLPDFRGAGIGSTVLRGLQQEGKVITLHVLKRNPAVRLYSRLGFVTTAEDEMYRRMEWTPQ